MDTKQCVRRALAIRPGAGISDLVRLTGKGNGSVEHAVYALQKEGDVVDHGWRRHPSYFLRGRGEAAGYLLRGAALAVYGSLQRRGAATVAELADDSNASKSEARRLVHSLEEHKFVAAVAMPEHHVLLLDAPQPGAR